MSKLFSKIKDFNITFNINRKIFPEAGFIKYQYNPLYNLKTNEDIYSKDDNGFYLDYIGNKIIYNNEYITDNNIYKYFNHISPSGIGSFTPNRLYVKYYRNELIPFRSDNLNLSPTNPVDIEVQTSYDGSVNLLINDDLNPPRLINSRFSILEDNTYKIIDRNGNNDTNIYIKDKIESTNLYKTISLIPKVVFNGIESGGELNCGNYTFYFKYVDSDGNETDFICESGSISIYNGEVNNPKSIFGGVKKSDKIIKLSVENLDNSYNYLNIYYTLNSSDTKINNIKAYKINNKFILGRNKTDFIITGLETVEEISLNEINITYNVINKAKTHAQVQSRYFMGNVDKAEIDYDELKDLSLRILGRPCIKESNNIGNVNELYIDDSEKYEYYNSKNIYYKLGYWEDFYRFGVVYIMNDYTLSPVFNVRGTSFDVDYSYNELFPNEINSDLVYKYIYTKSQTYVNGDRNKLELQEDGYIFNKVNPYENWKGVIKINSLKKDSISNSKTIPTGMIFEMDNDTYRELSKYVKGYFIVRQKRIPTLLCQGLSIGFDKLGSKLPLLKDKDGYFTESFLDQTNGDLIHDFDKRKLIVQSSSPMASIIPDAELNSELYLNLFSGTNYVLKESKHQPITNYLSNHKNHYFFKGYERLDKYNYYTSKLTFINEDINTKYSGSEDFSSKAGEEAVVYESKIVNRNIDNVTDPSVKKDHKHVRGIWNDYVGMENFSGDFKIFDVHVSGYDTSKFNEYFKLRFDSNLEYYPISDRITLNETTKSVECFRGDCFIGNYSKRMCRNFNDPESPYNDTIIDKNTWRDNYVKSIGASGVIDVEVANKTNRGDVNAVKIGHWVTCKFRSNYNISIRCNDNTHDAEMLLSGRERSFYPLSGVGSDGESKIPESKMINAGYNSVLSNKYNIVIPDIPYIKTDFSNRIVYSDIHVSDAFKNSYRSFGEMSYQDFTKEHGDIEKIFEWYGNLMIIFSHGIGIAQINERAALANTQGGEVFIGSNNIISDKLMMITSQFGSTWKDSIVKTTRYIYGFDTTAKKIWRTNGQIFEIISDFKVQSFLNDKITLKESDDMIVDSLINVKTHYNANKHDLLFTFYNEINPITGETSTFNLCYNELTSKWQTEYSWCPSHSESIDNIYFSSNKNDSKYIVNIASSIDNNKLSNGITLKDCFTNELFPSKYGDVNDYIPNIIMKGVEIINPLLLSSVKDVVIGELNIKLDLNNTFDRIEFEISEDKNYKYQKIFKIDSINEKYYLLLNKYSYLLSSDPLHGEMFDLYNSSDMFDIKLTCNIYQTKMDSNPIKYNDTVTVKKSGYNKNVGFYLHGQSGLFKETSDIKPTKWYGNQELFELEFIVNDNPSNHKLFENINIVSNKVFPEYMSYEIIGDSYEFFDIKDLAYNIQNGYNVSSNNQNYLEFIRKDFKYKTDLDIKVVSSNINVIFNPKTTQYSIKKEFPIRDIADSRFGFTRGNTRYKEDLFNITLDTLSYKSGKIASKEDISKLKIKETKPRDKYIKIRIKYSGDKLVLINSIQTIYNISFS